MPLSKVDPSQYQHQLDAKASRIGEQFAEFKPPALEIYPSEPLHFRMRAEFKIWHQDDDSFHAMFIPGEPKTPHRIDSFPIGSKRINALMPAIMDAVKAQPALRNKLFQIEYLTTQTNDALVTMIYHRKLDSEWQAAADTLQSTLGIHIIGRSRKQKLVLQTDSVTETLQVDKQQFKFQQVESGFTQPNAGINQKMLSWALGHSHNRGGDLLELYCGNGNFTAVLAQNFDKVLATEISKTSVRSAKHNFALNKVENAEVIRMSSEEFSSALLGEREFRRLKDIDLNSYNFSTVLVDPPRAGCDDNSLKLIARFDHIIYISCNPNTLQENLKQLCQTHAVEQFAIFDQFPYTEHIECGVLLTRTI